MLRIENKEQVTRVLFVLSARVLNTKDHREQMKLVCILPDGRMCCTDDHRLHMLQTEYPAGLYEVIKASAREVILNPTDYELGYFPDVSKVIPADDSLTLAITHEPGAPAWKVYTVFNRATKGTTLDYAYFEDALKQTNEIYTAGNEFAPVVFKGVGTLAFVMPCRI